MMLAMFLQSSEKRKRRHLDGSQILPLCAHRCSYMGGGGEQGHIQEPQALSQGVLSAGGNISSLRLGWMRLGWQEASSQCCSGP